MTFKMQGDGDLFMDDSEITEIELLDRFAEKALGAMITAWTNGGLVLSGDVGIVPRDELAKTAYLTACSMILERRDILANSDINRRSELNRRSRLDRRVNDPRHGVNRFQRNSGVRRKKDRRRES